MTINRDNSDFPMNSAKFQFSLASAAVWFLAFSIGLGLVCFGARRGLLLIFDSMILGGCFLLGSCAGMPIGHYVGGMQGARQGMLLGGGALTVLGFFWTVARHF